MNVQNEKMNKVNFLLQIENNSMWPMRKKENRIKWLNCAKTVAILGVMVDHCNGVLYMNPKVANASYYSISLFILISGITSYLSDSHHEEDPVQSFLRMTRKIISAYCIAVAVYLVATTHGFDLLSYLTYLIHFNISGPHYYVLLYIQLMILSRPLYMVLQKLPRTGGATPQRQELWL